MSRRLWLVGIGLVLIAAACGGDEESTISTTTTAAPAEALPTTGAEAGFPVEVNGVTIPAQPERLVSASATHTEILYAVGAGEAVVATDAFSNYPPAASDTEKIDAFNLNIEAIAAFDPDLVILAFDPGDAVAGLERLGIPTLLFDPPATLEGAYDQITAVGAATGHSEAAGEVVAGMRSDIDEIIDRVELPDEPVTFFHEIDATFYTVTSSTFFGGLYSLLGLENIADPADADGFGYPQLTAEYILDADPDIIFLADVAYGESAATVADRPGWQTLDAVGNGRIVELDADVASRWGPRIVDFLAAIADSLNMVTGS